MGLRQWGLWLAAVVQGDLPAIRALGEDLRRLAEHAAPQTCDDGPSPALAQKPFPPNESARNGRARTRPARRS